MKYLKTYEDKNLIDMNKVILSRKNKNLKYDVGDYVLLDIKKIKSNTPGEDIPFQDKALILFTNKIIGKYDYNVIFPDDIEEYSVDEVEIMRKLTSEEIEEYQTKKQMNKYNL